MTSAIAISTTQIAMGNPAVIWKVRVSRFARTSSSSVMVRLRAADLRKDLLRQGFTIQGGCSADRSVSWAEYQQRDSNGFGYYTPAFGTVYWKQDTTGRLVWATGDIAYTGL